MANTTWSDVVAVLEDLARVLRLCGEVTKRGWQWGDLPGRAEVIVDGNGSPVIFPPSPIAPALSVLWALWQPASLVHSLPILQWFWRLWGFVFGIPVSVPCALPAALSPLIPMFPLLPAHPTPPAPTSRLTTWTSEGRFCRLLISIFSGKFHRCNRVPAYAFLLLACTVLVSSKAKCSTRNSASDSDVLSSHNLDGSSSRHYG